MLTGEHVFTGETLVEVLSKHLNKPPVAPSEMLGHPVSADLEALILRCLAKDPLERPATGEELLEAFDQVRLTERWKQQDARHWWADFEAHGGRARVDVRTQTLSCRPGVCWCPPR